MIIQQIIFYSTLDINSNVYAIQKTASFYMIFSHFLYDILFLVRLEIPPKFISVKVLRFGGKVARIEYCITE